MSPSIEELKDKYKSLTDLELINLSQTGELTNEATSAINEELSRRQITSNKTEEIKKEEQESNVRRMKEGDIPDTPKIWIGFLLAILVFIGEIIHVSIYENEEVYFSIYITPFSIACFVYYLYIIRTIHSILSILTLENYPISSGTALALHFIPFLNIWWFFKWPSELSKYINQSENIKMLPGFIIGFFLLSSFIVITVIDRSLGYVLVFIVMSYVTTKVKKKVLYHQSKI